MAGMAKVAWVMAAVCCCWVEAQQTVHPVAGPILVTHVPVAGVVSVAASTVLLQMASHAGVIFSGEVVSVEHGGGFVDVRFRIDEAVRGCAQGGTKKSTYVLREWGGLWTGRPDRYRTGQRYLMVLTARGPAGMSSPVGGTDGAIPLIATGTAPIADAAGVAPPDMGVGSPALAVDLRWIEARAVRPVALGAVARPADDPGEWFGAVGPLHTTGSVAVLPPPLASVLALLRGASGSASSEVRNARY